MNCVIISFSSRKNGNCINIAEYIRRTFPDSHIFSSSQFQISSCGNCEGECFRKRELCPHYQDMEKTLVDAVCASDLAYYIIPNHCDFPCANFFTFNERSLCCFQGNNELLMQYLRIPKRFIVVSNSDSPYFRAAFLQHTDKEPDVCFIRAKTYGKSSIIGDILSSAQACQDLDTYILKEQL